MSSSDGTTAQRTRRNWAPVVIFVVLFGAVFTLGIPIIPLVVMGSARAVAEWWNREEFDSAKWKDKRLIEEHVRIRMVDDLLSRHDLRGKTREEVVAMLGEPDHAAEMPYPYMVYLLGPERGFIRIDWELLEIRLDEGGRVSDARVGNT